MEKSGAAHMELSKKLFDLSSEIRVYADKDLKERHRPHKKQFHQTAEATDKIQEGHLMTRHDTSRCLERVTCGYPLKAYRSKLDKATRKSC